MGREGREGKKNVNKGEECFKWLKLKNLEEKGSQISFLSFGGNKQERDYDIMEKVEEKEIIVILFL